MTWILKHKRSDRPMVAEYLCPVHGRFELTVDRDANGDPPSEATCPEWIDSPHHCQDPPCLDCGVNGWTCDEVSPFVMSNPGYAKVRAVEAVRGSYQRPERETWTDTTNIGEGQSLEDWEDDRAKVWDRQREAEVHAMTKEL